MSKDITVHAVIVAAGNSTRMGGTDSKIFGSIGGQSVLCRSASAFAQHPLVADITVVVREQDMERAAEELRNTAVSIPLNIVCGGKERIHSVAAGIGAISAEEGTVAIHDGARPLVTEDIITEAVSAVSEGIGTVPCVPVKDTVKVIDEEGFCVSTPERCSLRAVQTPQCFILSEFRTAMEKAIESGVNFTDDGGVFEAFGGRVKLTCGSYENLKITTPEDIPAAEAILLRRENI